MYRLPNQQLNNFNARNQAISRTLSRVHINIFKLTIRQINHITVLHKPGGGRKNCCYKIVGDQFPSGLLHLAR